MGRFSMRKLFSCFHLNLNFSVLSESEKEVVIDKCYQPFIELCETYPYSLGFEASASSLLQIKRYRPKLFNKLCDLINTGCVGFSQSGCFQIIWPLSTKRINVHNIIEGQKFVDQYIKKHSGCFYVPEQAFTPSMIPIIKSLGYNSIMIEMNNISHFCEVIAEEFNRVSFDGSEIGVLWNDSFLSRVFQRYVHGEITLDQQIEMLLGPRCNNRDAVCFYGSDLEIFNYRPKRFHYEGEIVVDEWGRIESFIESVFRANDKFQLKSVGEEGSEARTLNFDGFRTWNTSVFVKKQRKYNLSRWALSGRNDPEINSFCYAEKKLATRPDFIELWSSDLRTHIESDRWRVANAQFAREKQVIEPFIKKLPDVVKSRFLEISLEQSLFKLDLLKGASLSSWKRRIDESQIFGSIGHEIFINLDYGVDLFSFHFVCFDRYWQKWTDLVPVSDYQIQESEGRICQIDFRLRVGGRDILKSYAFSDGGRSVKLTYKRIGFLLRDARVFRAGYVNLNSEMFDRGSLRCHTEFGSGIRETIMLDEYDYDCGVPVNPLVSSHGLLPMTNGSIVFESKHAELRIIVDQSKNYCLVGSQAKRLENKDLIRFWLSFSESDETWRPRTFTTEELTIQYYVN